MPSSRGHIQATREAEGLSGISRVTQYVGDRDVVLTHATRPSQPSDDLLDTFFFFFEQLLFKSCCMLVCTLKFGLALSHSAEEVIGRMPILRLNSC